MSESTDQIVQLLPSKETQHEIKKKYPSIIFSPLPLRLIKYTIANETYCLGTTLTDQKYTGDDFKNVYPARWGIEELYKVSKNFIDVSDFHGRIERTVKQKLFAHFVLITMSRLCANESENLLSKLFSPMDREKGKNTPEKRQANFKNTLAAVSRHLEDFMFIPAHCIKIVMDDLIGSVSRLHKKVRPGRSFERKSMKPESKWRGSHTKAKEKTSVKI